MLGIEWGEALRWYLTLQLWSLPCLVLGSVLFQDLPDRGYAAAKFLGLLSIGWIAWLGFAWLAVPFTPWLPWLVWALLLSGGGVLYVRDRRSRFLRGVAPAPRPRAVDCLLVETLFCGVFVGWIWVVAHDPGIDHTEQPMDYMFLAALWQTRQYPPQDPWLSGFAISHYYFGYWMMATMAKGSQVAPQVAYNLATASWYGFLWLGVYGVAFNVIALLGRAREFKVYRQWYAWAAGLLAALVTAGMGTLSGVLEFLYAFGLVSAERVAWFDIAGFPDRAAQTRDPFITSESWWWWRSTRVIHDKTPAGDSLEVITEFPVFSYLLGDNHPHVMAAPILLLAVTLLLQFMVQSRHGASAAVGNWLGNRSWRAGSDTFPARWGRMLTGFLLLTAGVLTNTWDGVSLTVLVTGGLAFSLVRNVRTVKFLLLCTMGLGAALLVLSAAVLLPHHLLLQTPIEGVRVNVLNPTRWHQLLVFWGPLLLICPLLAGLAVSKGLFSGSYFLWTAAFVLGTSGLILALGLVRMPGSVALASLAPPSEAWISVGLQRWTRSLPLHLGLALLFSLMLTFLWSWWSDKAGRQRSLSPYVLLVFCAGLALGLIYVVEFLFVNDGFGPLMRMNTVFKFYYQAWPLLGIVLGTTVALILIQKRHQPRFVLPLFGIVLLTASCFYYPWAAVGGQIRSNRHALTIDVRTHLRRLDPDLAQALDWIEANVRSGDVVLEAPGNSYVVGHNRISSLSGYPTLHGWERHERHWRGSSYAAMSAGRMAAASTIYATGTPDQVAAALQAWNIGYVFVGPHEREKYGFGAERQMALVHVLIPVFEVGDVQIFKPIA